MVKNSLIYILGMIISKGIFYLMTPIYTTHLNPSEFGLITLINTIIGLISILYILGMNGSLTRFYIDQESSFDKKRLVYSTIIFLLTISIILSGFIILGVSLLTFSDLINVNTKIFWLVLFLSMTSLFQVVPQVILRMEEKALKFIIFSTLDSLSILLSTLLFISLFNDNLEGALLALAISRVAMIGLYILFLLNYLDYKLYSIDKNILKEMIIYGFPLIPHSLALWANNLGDRIIIENKLSLLEVGIYSLGAQFSSLVMLVITSFSQAFTPTYFRKINNNQLDQRTFNTTIILVSGSLSIISMVIYIMSPYIINIIAGEEYKYDYDFIGVLLVAGIFQLFYIFGFAPLSYFKKNKVIAKITFTSAILHLLLNLMIIPYFGIMGAAIASMTSYFIRFILIYVLSIKYTKDIYSWPMKRLFFIVTLLVSNLIMIPKEIVIQTSSLSSLVIIILIIICYKIERK